MALQSIGWYKSLNKKFNTLVPPTITIAELYACITPTLITHDEYIQILQNSWNTNPQYYIETDFRAWVVSGYLTETEFTAITGIAY